MTVPGKNNDNMNTRLLTIIRWIILLPASIVALFLTNTIVKEIYQITAAKYVDSDSWLTLIFFDVISYGVAGIAYVLVGYFIAPNGKKVTSIILAGIILLVSGAALFVTNFITKDYYSNLGIICTNVGSIMACVVIFTNEKVEI